ncbi:MAG: glutamine-hydrolyzing carbamoyl-phosphate synthase small subunit [Candidatus Micrarchaeota archaeon]|nr:glutamine-hydrolyzing carbamoyl-phosphate synthase small subunit [Candidatus Micrarchaeota archaeon]
MFTEKKAVLVLSDGSAFFGKGFGALERRVGEIVFTTNMAGYEESLTDPSYAGQILVSTYPLIGNYGTGPAWRESDRIQVEGYAVREICAAPWHEKSASSLDKALAEAGIPGIFGIDTRELVRKIRDFGVMPACLSAYEKEEDIAELVSIARELDYSKINFVERVSVGEAKCYGEGSKKVVLLDFGAKMGIIRELVKRGCEVVAVPFNTSAEEVLSFEPDGVLVSNGPGDPALLSKESSEIGKLFGKLPLFGICLGNQLIAQAAGARTYKLKFGHRGGNHPVLDLRMGRVAITTQNHGYAVDEKTLPPLFRVTHTNLIDGTVEGIAHAELPVFAVQYHPEARPGPHDSKYLFDDFVAML